MNDYNAETRNEAEHLFKHLAVDFLLKNDSLFHNKQTYTIENNYEDPFELIDDIGNSQEFEVYLQSIFSPENGELLTFEEIWDQNYDGNAQTSMSIKRAPDPKAFNQLIGSSSNVPFLPGGFDDIELEKIFCFSDNFVQKSNEIENEEEKYLNFTELLITPPGFTNTVDFRNLNIPFVGKLLKGDVDLDKESLEIPEIFDNAENKQNSTSIKNVDTIIKYQSSQKSKDIENKEDTAGNMQNNEFENTFLKLDFLKDKSLNKIQENSKKLKKTMNEPEFQFAQLLDVNRMVDKYDILIPILAKTYPFTLDPFQQQAVVSMEEGSSVFVAAHTSAGKTVVAEYAIALCKAHKTRVIYTSPIKALSNQKFRDFKNIFGDVGLITGDIQLHSDAFCLIMTTEILRSMLYNGSEVIRELEWVIFDEVHYINDVERGHVWEEVLIMLPSHVKIVMLSATVPNCVEFADWVGRIKNRKINVIQTLKRPVPLEHFLYTGQDGKTKNDRFLIMNKNGELKLNNYYKCLEAKKNATKKSNSKNPNNRPNSKYSSKNDKNIYINLIDHLRQLDLLPMVGFIFSRKRCDETAELLVSVDLTTAKEKSEIHHFFTKCIARLKGTDHLLPQVQLMYKHCLRGFATHHSGILPILKEIVELLFQRGYVKILFATETFAMGVNMPARTVVFDDIEKFDGNERRFLNVTEYIQMAGRAGRRGLDSTGTVIIICKGSEPPDLNPITSILKGKPIRLDSKFRITYRMILNLLRVEQLKIEDMLQRSFVERTSLRLMNSRKEQILELEKSISELPKTSCLLCYPENDRTASIRTYYKSLKIYCDETKELLSNLILKAGYDKLLVTGRIIIINYFPLGLLRRTAVVLRVKHIETGKFQMELLVSVDGNFWAQAPYKLTDYKLLTDVEKCAQKNEIIMEQVALNGFESVEKSTDAWGILSSKSYFVLKDVDLESLVAICKQTLKGVQVEFIEQDFNQRIKSYRNMSPDRFIQKTLKELNSFTDSCLNGNLQKNSESLIYQIGRELVSQNLELNQHICQNLNLRAQLSDLKMFECLNCYYLKEHLRQLMNQICLEERRSTLLYQTSSDSLLMSRDYISRLRVLQALGCVDKDNMVCLKGKVACEINHQELLITELMLENKFENKTSAEIAAMLSPLSCQFSAKVLCPVDENGVELISEVNRAPPELINRLKNDVTEVALRLDKLQETFQINQPIIDEIKFDAMEAIYQWAKGMPFSDIMKLTDAQEGLIVRCIQRLDEVCKDVRKAAKIIGNPALYEKMEETSAIIKRDIVFAASLYTTD